MKEVSSCQENIDTEAISEKEKKKKAEFVAQPNGPFCWRKVPSYQENVDLEAIRKHTKLYRIDCSTYRAFCIYLIVWTALLDKRSLPWRSVAEASPVNHERFPGRDVLKSALLNGQTWFARSETKVAEPGSPASFFFLKKTHAMIGYQNFAAAVKSCRTDGQNISSFGHGRCAGTWLRLEMEQIYFFSQRWCVSATVTTLIPHTHAQLPFDHILL